MCRRYNKGEWSELYAFAKLLKDGRIYAADENVNMIENVYFPILKILREEEPPELFTYEPGQTIKIFRNDELIEQIPVSEVERNAQLLFNKIFEGGGTSGSFEIREIDHFLDTMNITKIKADSNDKADMTLQVHDIHTGYNPVVGFSVKSDVGSPPTLLNAGKNTRVVYEIKGITDEDMDNINSIDKSVTREYMKARISELLEKSREISFVKIKDQTFEDNLILIDSNLPAIFGELVLLHYRLMDLSVYDCELLTSILSEINPLNYNRRNIVYRYKFKKMITAAALGMTPGKCWDGYETATGGYIIIKKDGDVLCYHLYNRDYFEEYLMRNTNFDRPSASKHEYGFIYKQNEHYYIDLNVQIRFNSIKKSAAKSSDKFKENAKQAMEYAKSIYTE